MGMAGHFVFTAELDPGGLVGAGTYQYFVALPVEGVGMKAPGLGLASTRVEQCRVREPSLGGRPCESDQAVALDQAGAICGRLQAEVCTEDDEILTVDAEFLAGRSIDQCIR